MNIVVNIVAAHKVVDASCAATISTSNVVMVILRECLRCTVFRCTLATLEVRQKKTAKLYIFEVVNPVSLRLQKFFLETSPKAQSSCEGQEKCAFKADMRKRKFDRKPKRKQILQPNISTKVNKAKCLRPTVSLDEGDPFAERSLSQKLDLLLL